jgi:hypothetical protein
MTAELQCSRLVLFCSFLQFIYCAIKFSNVCCLFKRPSFFRLHGRGCSPRIYKRKPEVHSYKMWSTGSITVEKKIIKNIHNKKQRSVRWLPVSSASSSTSSIQHELTILIRTGDLGSVRGAPSEGTVSESLVRVLGSVPQAQPEVCVGSEFFPVPGTPLFPSSFCPVPRSFPYLPARFPYIDTISILP